MFLAIEQLHGETEDGWSKLADLLKQVIKANNTSAAHLKKTEANFSQREDIMDGRISWVRVSMDMLQAKVTLAILDRLRLRILIVL